MRRLLMVAVFGLLAVLGACGSVRDDQGRASTADEVGEDASGEAAPDAADGAPVAAGVAAAGGGGVSGAGPLPQVATRPTDRIVKSAEIRVEVGDGRFRAAWSEAASIAAAHGGFVASSSAATGDDDRSGTLVIRVPAERFDAAREAIGELGEVESETLRGEDVGGQLTDLEARLRNLRAQEEAIRALMARAKDVPETMTVQQELFRVREQIEQLAGQQARLTDLVAMATITATVREPGAAVGTGGGSRLGDAVERAVDGALLVVGALVVGIGYALPLALLAGLTWAGVRVAHRARRPLAPTD